MQRTDGSSGSSARRENNSLYSGGDEMFRHVYFVTGAITGNVSAKSIIAALKHEHIKKCKHIYGDVLVLCTERKIREACEKHCLVYKKLF